MSVNISEVIKCGNKLYYDINPNSKKDVPSFFFEKLEGKYLEWVECKSELDFYEFCKKELINKK